METLMIHEVTEQILKLDLSKYILTFDDGLYSQYYYWNLLKDIPTTKIFFISSGAIRLDETCRPQFNGMYKTFPTCYEAMERWFSDGYLNDYMTLGELKKMRSEGAIIGAHGHMHVGKYKDCFISRLEEFRNDNISMAKWFRENLGEIPKHYCFPFNKEHQTQRAVIHVETGIKDFYGKDRKNVVELL